MTGTHSLNSPSSLFRREGCPGSARMEAKYEDQSSVYAQEGTCAHSVIERALEKNAQASEFVGKADENGIEVDSEMVEHCQTFLDYVRGLNCDPWYAEEKYELAFLGADEKGTADFSGIADKTLHVVDFKYGRKLVEVNENSQLICYAIGASKRFDNHDWDQVQVTIVQPRAAHTDGPIRSFTIPRDELFDYEIRYARVAARTRDPDAPLNPGEWCFFCKARADCPARNESVNDALEEFEVIEEGETERLAEALKRVPQIRQWCKDIETRATDLAKSGRSLPGWKLVPTRATREWRIELSPVDVLVNMGLREKDYTDLKMKSPAQIEKLVGKPNMKKLDKFVIKESKGVTLVPDDDPREPVNSLEDSGFEVIDD